MYFNGTLLSDVILNGASINVPRIRYMAHHAMYG